MIDGRYKPAVRRRYLALVAGLIWCLVGTGLCVVAGLWLAAAQPILAVVLALAGVGGAWAVGRLGFSRLVRQNLERISAQPRMACLFGFQSWKSYVIIAVMITTGAVLRHTGVPKPGLAVVYLVMGGALIVASPRYFREFMAR